VKTDYILLCWGKRIVNGIIINLNRRTHCRETCGKHCSILGRHFQIKLSRDLPFDQEHKCLLGIVVSHNVQHYWSFPGQFCESDGPMNSVHWRTTVSRPRRAPVSPVCTEGRRLVNRVEGQCHQCALKDDG